MSGQYKDLGWANAWKKTPKAVIQCENQHHTLIVDSREQSKVEYRCPKCKIFYHVDRSG